MVEKNNNGWRDWMNVIAVVIIDIVVISILTVLLNIKHLKDTSTSTFTAAIVYQSLLIGCIMGSAFFGLSVGKRYDAEKAGLIVGLIVGLFMLFPAIGGIIKNVIFHNHHFR